MIGPMGENLVFVVAPPRSGTTLVQRVLNAHSRIFAPNEPWVMLHPLYALKPTGYPGLTTNYRADLAREGLKDFCALLPEGEETYVRHLRLMFTRLYNLTFSFESEKTIFVDKTPRYFYIVPELRRVFPQAKIILLLRNPLAVLASIIDSWTHDNWAGLAEYHGDLSDGPRLMAAALKENTFAVRYESLTARPEEGFSRLCDALGVPFEKTMLDYGNTPAPGRMGDSIGLPRHTRPVHDPRKWIRTLAKQPARQCAEEYLASLDDDTLNCLGYPREWIQSELRSVS